MSITAEAANQSAYCVRCRKVGAVKDAEFVTTKNGLRRLKARCQVCSTSVSKITGKA